MPSRQCRPSHDGRELKQLLQETATLLDVARHTTGVN